MDKTWSTAQLSHELVALWRTGRQAEPFSRRFAQFDLSAAYDVVAEVARLRRKLGEQTVGRKIGFTNRSIWGQLGITAPIWNFIFDTTVSETVAQPSINPYGMPEPRIEPEMVLHLASAPVPGMSTADLLECIDWVAPAFEIVFSIFPNWKFTAADAAAAYGVHGALILGERFHLAGSRRQRDEQLHSFTVELESEAGELRRGRATDVLGGPVEALRFLREEIGHRPECEPLQPGELITTGTLTEAMPVKAGDVWSARFGGVPVSSIRLRIE
ncbi:fumarylacetoacetate hydrolase family protein [Mesorhizobium sp. WSM3882]|uniref:2-keto-4-pentenoate hydratase n=1 Tax=Mesorhizobium sp. WSM3882 TaxID=2029407 RepID=UPI000BAFC01B|nr:fumarylacetoacetate hydrolase family protein [Mesorhizobium sp. WSM3882]